MKITIQSISDHELAEYQTVPISFPVERVFEPVAAGENHIGLNFRLQPVAEPWIKEYDEPGNCPADWGDRWDLTHWGFLVARSGGKSVGGCAMAWRTPGLDMLEGRDDLVVLWDLRVSRECRGQGLGKALFAAAVQWARERGAAGLKIETQNINAGACGFYAAQGCRLSAINTRAYPDLPAEVQFIWYYDVSENQG